jgi:acyl carrier protein
MIEDALEARVCALVVDVLGLDGGPGPEATSNLFDEFGLESAGLLSLVTAIEDEFGIELEDDDISRETFTSVRSIAARVRQR